MEGRLSALHDGRLDRGPVGRGRGDHQLDRADVAGEPLDDRSRDLERRRELAAEETNLRGRRGPDRFGEAGGDHDQGPASLSRSDRHGLGLACDGHVRDAGLAHRPEGVVDEAGRKRAAVLVDDDEPRVECREVVGMSDENASASPSGVRIANRIADRSRIRCRRMRRR